MRCHDIKEVDSHDIGDSESLYIYNWKVWSLTTTVESSVEAANFVYFFGFLSIFTFPIKLLPEGCMEICDVHCIQNDHRGTVMVGPF